jgi:hypothetical protein
MRRQLDEEQQEVVAQEIVKDLELNNWKFELGPESEGHGPNLIPKTTP